MVAETNVRITFVGGQIVLELRADVDNPGMPGRPQPTPAPQPKLPDPPDRPPEDPQPIEEPPTNPPEVPGPIGDKPRRDRP